MILQKLKDYYYILVPLIITFLVYSISLTYGFRAFDEDVIIQNFYVHKTFGEYIEKFFLLHFGGVTEAHGFTFSGVKNVHVSVLGIPVFYLISFLFQAKPFLFHLWSLLLHCLALYFFIMFCYRLTQSKEVALFSGLLWTLHPTNVEPVIWACNWAQPFGAVFYFYTLYKIAYIQDMPRHVSTMFIVLITLVQILFTEHTVTIPIAIFLTILYQSKNFTSAFKTSLPSFIVIFAYSILRVMLTRSSGGVQDLPLYERLIFFSPQIFIHQLKLVLFPINLTIDQIDLLNLDKIFFGAHHIFCILFFVFFIFLIFLTRNKFSNFSYGLLLYFVTILPFIQIMPLYSLVAERYNYFGSAFLIFGVVATLMSGRYTGLPLQILLSFVILFSGIRSFTRITDWRNSQTLFLSTINTSKSLLKKGIWTYNLAVETPRRDVSTQKDESKRDELLKLSINLLDLFMQGNSDLPELKILSKYQLDKKSLLVKAAVRIATNYEILNQKDKEQEYLLKALDFSKENIGIQGLIYKNLGTLYFQKGDFNNALDNYIKCNLILKSPVVDYAIATCYLQMKDFVTYEKYLKKSVSIISQGSGTQFKIYGQFLELSKHDYEGAIKYYKIATLLENSPEPYVLLSTVYLKQKQIDKALKVVQSGLYGFQKDPSLNYLHGTILISKGKKDEGIKILKEVVESATTPEDIKAEARKILVDR